ncbi:MAG TPA: hypothetical protein VFQ68_12230 [Streptosporangiaceae bacterium]|nr:hypothetical protein [Streptosporangiaceae bacterium]
MPHNAARLRARAIVGTTLVLVLVVAVFAIYHNAPSGTPAPPPPGCQAGTGEAAIALDTEQAAIAATIAGVAARHRLPKEAVTIALAAGLQESKLHNLDYGDRDSVGIFQQRPSEGWGPAEDLMDPVYATTKFFAALTHIHGYTTMPVYEAAQEVQHSADGSAYQQWEGLAGQLAGYFTGKSPHGVSCWYPPPAKAGQANLAGAVQRISATFGPAGRKAVVARVSLTRSGKKGAGRTAVLHVRQASAWTVANWLVAYAQVYGLSEVRYAGYVWKATNGTMGWQRAPTPTRSSGKNASQGGIVAG